MLILLAGYSWLIHHQQLLDLTIFPLTYLSYSHSLDIPYAMLQIQVEMFNLTLTSHLCLTSLLFRDTKLNTKHIIVLLVSQWIFFCSCTVVRTVYATDCNSKLFGLDQLYCLYIYSEDNQKLSISQYHMNICKKSGVLFMSLENKEDDSTFEFRNICLQS